MDGKGFWGFFSKMPLSILPIIIIVGINVTFVQKAYIYKDLQWLCPHIYLSRYSFLKSTEVVMFVY